MTLLDRWFGPPPLAREVVVARQQAEDLLRNRSDLRVRMAKMVEAAAEELHRQRLIQEMHRVQRFLRGDMEAST